ncbi:hypothetical protein [Nesterenkonia halophila]|uniref:hypothetical protein n=1 Tax=Nesterenkonia halophila TaxID=302044 RepID=UPI00129257A0|nr:hypothetical protein [Nesterenkonia halophila]
MTQEMDELGASKDDVDLGSDVDSTHRRELHEARAKGWMMQALGGEEVPDLSEVARPNAHVLEDLRNLMSGVGLYVGDQWEIVVHPNNSVYPYNRVVSERLHDRYEGSDQISHEKVEEFAGRFAQQYKDKVDGCVDEDGDYLSSLLEGSQGRVPTMTQSRRAVADVCGALMSALIVVSGCTKPDDLNFDEGSVCGDSEDVRWCCSTRADDGAYSVSHGALLCEVRQVRRLIGEGRVDHQAMVHELPDWADGGFRRGQPTIVRISEVPAADVLSCQKELRVAVEELGASFDGNEVTECGDEMSHKVVESAEGQPLQMGE